MGEGVYGHEASGDFERALAFERNGVRFIDEIRDKSRSQRSFA